MLLQALLGAIRELGPNFAEKIDRTFEKGLV